MKQRVFTQNDQLAFARLSGDFNPIHIDPVAARRLLFGGPVVHGIHALLWSLDACLAEESGDFEIQKIRSVFSKPIRVDEEVTLLCSNEGEGSRDISLKSGGAVLATVHVELKRYGSSCPVRVGAQFPPRDEPRDLTEDEIEDDSGCLDLFLEPNAAARLFPNLVARLSALNMAILLCTTRLAGVKCPGLHSVYYQLELEKSDATETAQVAYRVETFDRRFSLAKMHINAPGMTGVLTALRRPAPQQQASCLSLMTHVSNEEFCGQRALVIGGSRGLGEVAAKLLAMGGAEVSVTYNQGADDAERVVCEIVDSGGVADSFRFDALSPGPDPFRRFIGERMPTDAYYFATPFIVPGVKGAFSPTLFRKYCDFYVVGFQNTAMMLNEIGTQRIFYPSTAYIDELPSNMGEYAAAKAAGETLCRWLENACKGMRVSTPRFPRVATDQTVSSMPVANEDPVPLLIKELRAFRDRAD